MICTQLCIILMFKLPREHISLPRVKNTKKIIIISMDLTRWRSTAIGRSFAANSAVSELRKSSSRWVFGHRGTGTLRYTGGVQLPQRWFWTLTDSQYAAAKTDRPIYSSYRQQMKISGATRWRFVPRAAISQCHRPSRCPATHAALS